MGNRRFAQALTSDDEDDNAPPRGRSSDENPDRRKRKVVHFADDDDDEEEEGNKIEEAKVAEQDNEEDYVDAQPIGAVVRVSGRGRGRRSHYESFEYNGHQYHLEDPALFHPENKDQKPYVAIIKDIARTQGGEMMVTGQWFYRPEEAELRGRGNWQSCDARELFYSFHRDEVPAESIFHKCVVHFIPLNKQLPRRQQHPGFIVQKVYDTEQLKLFKLTDKDYEEDKKEELNLLVQKTLARVGDLPDLEPEDTNADHEDRSKDKRLAKRKNMSHLDVAKEDKGLRRSISLKSETPRNAAASSSEHYAILSNCMLLTGETQRDKWSEKLLQLVQFICTPSNSESHDKASSGQVLFDWPDAAVSAVVALEKAANDAHSADFQKYNQKMRQLAFNLKSNAALARRLLSKELQPAQILNMSPTELKEGLTAEEIASRKPEEPGHLQMTDARTTIFTEKQVG